ncbi:hypothetical protein G9A89_015321 [Geosiphon pyriformis]|nr:hypothetical protein G9A89_015321 [Geosiphon pyriformis]
MAISEKILVNDDIRKVNNCSDRKSVLVRKNSVCVAKTIGNKQTWVSRDQHRTLFYTLPIGTTAHDLFGLLDSYGGKTCVIGCNLIMYVRDRCAVICFVDEASKLAAIGSAPIFKGVGLHWAGLFLACCMACKQFGHVFGACSVGKNSGGHGKHVVTSQNWVHLANIYRKKHTPITHLVSFGSKTWAQITGNSPFCVASSVASGIGLIPGVKPFSMASGSLDISDLGDHLASLECFLELLADRVSSIVKKLSFVKLVLLVSLSCVFFSAIFAPMGLVKDSDMALDDGLTLSVFSFSGADESAVVLSSSGLKVLISKVGGLKSKMFALEASIGSVLVKLDLLCSNSADIVCWHVSSRNMVSFIKDKFDGIQIFTSGLDVGYFSAGVAVIMNNFLACHVSKIDKIPGQVFEINSIIAKAVNTSTFIVLDEDFNESRSGRSLVRDFFSDAKAGGDLDTMWAILEKEMVDSADKVFLRHWFSEFQCSRNRHSSKFFGLELLIAKIVSKICFGNMLGIDCLVRKWSTLDKTKACVFSNLVILSGDSVVLFKHLSLVCKEYRRSKMFESRLAEEVSIWNAIDKCMESFASNKDSMIRSVLNWSFCKVVLDHLVVDSNLVLEPKEVKSKVDEIMVGWTRVHTISLLLPDYWICQYISLNYVRNKAFSGVMKEIGMEELLLVVGDLPDGKTTGLSNGFELSVDFAECLLVCWQVSMISKPYNWDGVFTNTHLIALIETARKIFFKSPVFAVGAVVENTLKKNRKLWLVLQDMRKAYDSVGLQRIKMCDKFIKFFGNIHKSRFNKVMTDFGLSDGYCVCDNLDQGEVFSLLLWRIFYNPLLCEVKRHEQFFGSGRLSSYFAVGAFIDDMIWVGNCQAATQNILDIASEFFVVNNISINNEKTMAIPINLSVKIAFLSISGLPILIAKKGETHCYLGIFLSTEGLSKPSVAKTYFNVHFFANVVLRKAIINKQFLYLVSVILQPIISYHTQFSFVLSNICCKWDVILRKRLKSKAGLSRDFSSEALCHLSLYGLKFFEQVQSKEKLAALISFSNFSEVLGQFFKHRCLNLQVLKWSPLNPLQFLVKLCVNSVNNFLAGVVKIFLCNELSLSNGLSNAFRSPGSFLVSSILRSSLHFNSVYLLMHFGVVFGNRLGPVSHWFRVVSDFFCSTGVLLASSMRSTCVSGLNILDSKNFSSDLFEVFMDGSLKNFGHIDVAGSTAVYFSAIDLSINVRVYSLLSFTMAKLQAIALSLECVPSFCTVVVAIDVCVSEMLLSIKIKGHSGILGNVKADAAAGDTAFSHLSLPVSVQEQFLVAEGTSVFSNAHHFAVDWGATTKVWHPDSSYLGVLCLLCHEVELPNHVFTYSHDVKICGEVLAVVSADWLSMVSPRGSLPSAVLQSLGQCSVNVKLYSVLCKGFVLREWYAEAVGIFDSKKKTVSAVVGFVECLVKLHRFKAWLARSVFRVRMEKAGLVGDDSLFSGLSHCLGFLLSDKVVRMLSIAGSFAVSFGHCRSCLFFFGLDGSLCVSIGV